MKVIGIISAYVGVPLAIYVAGYYLTYQGYGRDGANGFVVGWLLMLALNEAWDWFDRRIERKETERRTAQRRAEVDRLIEESRERIEASIAAFDAVRLNRRRP